jgi:hypothetical protein
VGDFRPGRDDGAREVFPVSNSGLAKDGNARDVLPRNGTGTLSSTVELESGKGLTRNCNLN